MGNHNTVILYWQLHISILAVTHRNVARSATDYLTRAPKSQEQTHVSKQEWRAHPSSVPVIRRCSLYAIRDGELYAIRDGE